MDSKIVQVALNGLENILRLGEQEGKRSGSGVNPYCGLIEEAYGMCPLLNLGQNLRLGLQRGIHMLVVAECGLGSIHSFYETDVCVSRTVKSSCPSQV